MECWYEDEMRLGTSNDKMITREDGHQKIKI